MAVNLTEKMDGKIIQVVITGKLHQSDYDYFVPQIEKAIQRHGKIRIFLQMIDFHGWSVCALWEDLKFDIQHFRDVEQIAMVGDKSWEKGMAMFCKPFTTAKIRYFETSELGEAQSWIEKGCQENAASSASDPVTEAKN